ncbi:MAG: hypothetical protein ACFE9L_16525 [Candidatus Hodarchaeota archaeon]
MEKNKIYRIMLIMILMVILIALGGCLQEEVFLGGDETLKCLFL